MTLRDASFCLLFLMLLPGCAATPPVSRVDGGEATASPFKTFVRHSIDDHRRHYRGGNLLDLLPPLAASGVLANTEADHELRDFWQDELRSDTSNDVARIFLRVGDAGQNKVAFPLYSLTMIAAGYTGTPERDSAVATWAERSLRANILGGPQAWALTYALGSHRPGVGSSGWNPWNDNDGVSGHSFYGAVPLLTAARMTDNRAWKYSLYALSTLPAWARLNDNQHYTSQALMGWSIAWLATRTIAAEDGGTSYAITPLLLPDGAYVALIWQF